MRKNKLHIIYISFFSILLLSSCSDHDDYKAKLLIKKHLKESLNDWKSYESVSYGDLDSIYTSPFEDFNIQITMSRVQEYLDETKRYIGEVERYKEYNSDSYADRYRVAYENAKKYKDSMNIYKIKLDTLMKNFIPEFSGWAVAHTFRSNNALGNKVIGHYKYYFDKEITKIIDTEDLSKGNY